MQTEVPRTGLREEARVGCRSAMQVFRTAATRIMRNRSGCRSVWDLLTIRLGNGDVSDQSVGRDCQDLDFYQEAGSVSVTGVPPRSRSHRNRSMYADCNRSHCKTQTQRWPTIGIAKRCSTIGCTDQSAVIVIRVDCESMSSIYDQERGEHRRRASSRNPLCL